MSGKSKIHVLVPLCAFLATALGVGLAGAPSAHAAAILAMAPASGFLVVTSWITMAVVSGLVMLAGFGLIGYVVWTKRRRTQVA